ncbi:MAG: TonB-dependent receptor [Acidobacteria bacterium]|nr:MAG: TonB-dependent receptor [Acidobacteriota bacterium]
MMHPDRDESATPHGPRRRPARPGWIAAALCSTSTLLGSLPAAAQQPASDPVEETVTVTAQRVEQDLQEVPISVIAVSGEELDERAIDDLQELADSTPGMVVTGQAPSNGEMTISIRGIGSNTFGLGTESTVGFYVDGFYVPRPQGFVNQFLDLERVEVLRGPQGTLWGRNSTGGALNVLTTAPGRELSGRISASYGELDSEDTGATESQLELAVGGAASERVWARFAGSLTQNEDYTYNELLDRRFDNLDGHSLRLGLTLLPTDAVSLTLRGDLTEDDAHNNFNLRPGDISPLSTLGTLQRFYGLPTAPADVHRIAANVPPIATYEENGLSLDLSWVLTLRVNLQSLTGLRDFDSLRQADIDGTPLDFVENLSELEGEWWSQEIKLDGRTERTDWIAGVYFFHEEGFNQIDTRTDLALFEVDFFANNPGLFLFDPSTFCSLGFIAPSFLCGIDYYSAIAPFLGLSLPGNVSTGNFFVTDLETDSYAVYGQGYWHLGDRWTLTGGLRYTDDDKSHLQTTIDFQTQQPFTQLQEGGWDALTPKLGLEYRPSERTLLYASLTTGFKSGGFNSISVQPAFDEETILSTEVGFKTRLLDDRLDLRGALFNYAYDDLQVAVLFPDRSTVENAAEATVNGLELDLVARPSRALTFTLGVSLLDDEFDSFRSQDPLAAAAAQNALRAQGIFDPVLLAQAAAAVPTRDLSGNGLPRAPDYSISAALQHRWDLRRAGALTTRLQLDATDDVAYDGFGNLGQPAYELLAAQLSYRPQRGSWFASLYARNLTDEEYIVNEIFFSVAGSVQVWAPPRTVGVQFGWDF